MNELDKKVIDLVVDYKENDSVEYSLCDELADLLRHHSDSKVMPYLYKAAAALYWDKETFEKYEIGKPSLISEVVDGIYMVAKLRAEKDLIEFLGLDDYNSGGVLSDLVYCGDTPRQDERKKLLTELIDDLTQVRDSL